MIWILTFLLVVSLMCNVVLIKGGLIASSKLDTYETFLVRMREQVNYVINVFALIDSGGHFASDDEVGDTFKSLKSTAESLSNFLDKE